MVAPWAAAIITAALQQNPSPMIDTTRAHERLPLEPPAGAVLEVEAGLAQPVRVFIPPTVNAREPVRLLVHFHGAASVAMHAAARARVPTVAASVHLGAGSRVYEDPFAGAGAFDRLLAPVLDALAAHAGSAPRVTRIHLSAFSAGYGAVRALARDASLAARVDGVLLLDGLHTSYVPEGKVLAEGGALDAANLEPFVNLARLAVDGRIGFVCTHSEIFPGTFASTTETADYLLDRSGVTRAAVLRWGPHGMQQLSEASAGRLRVLGFAGNTAPDHVDHLHALPAMLAHLAAR